MPAQHRFGAHLSWAKTVDRSARTRPARRNSPSSIEYHLDRLPDPFADATDQQRTQAAEAAKKGTVALGNRARVPTADSGARGS